jgi:hypothetical protein
MSAQDILQNPALFAGYKTSPWEAVETFMSKVMRAPIQFKLIVHHLSEMVGSYYSMKGFGALVTKAQRMEKMSCGSMAELIEGLDGGEGGEKAVRKSGSRFAFRWDGSRNAEVDLERCFKPKNQIQGER